MKKVLPFFSYLFHPIFISILGTLFFLIFDESYITRNQQLAVFIQVFIVTFLLPIAFFYLLKTFGKIDSVMLSDISQRKIPLLLQIMLLSVLIIRSITHDTFPELHFFFFGGLLSAILAFLFLYLKIKTSIHMIGMSALTSFLIGLSYHNQVNIINTIVFFVIMTGVVASSRLVMQAHTRKELLIGFIFGALPQILLFYFWL